MGYIGKGLIRVTFAERLKTLRRARNLTQRELAEQAGCTQSLIAMYERGTRKPKIESIEALADFFNVDVDYLLGKTVKTTVLPMRPTLTPKEEDHIRKYRTLTPERRAYIDGQISAFLSEK